MKRKLGRSLWTERACWIAFLQFCRSVYILCFFFGVTISVHFKRAVVFVKSSEGRKEVWGSF